MKIQQPNSDSLVLLSSVLLWLSFVAPSPTNGENCVVSMILKKEHWIFPIPDKVKRHYWISAVFLQVFEEDTSHLTVVCPKIISKGPSRSAKLTNFSGEADMYFPLAFIWLCFKAFLFHESSIHSPHAETHAHQLEFILSFQSGCCVSY